jgi:phosphotransferase system enzyme I (PtsI)
LIQYSLAVDRGNEKVAYLYEPAHPGVLRLIQRVIESAKERNIWVGMCGEMAQEVLSAFILLGMGLDEFSIPPPRIPRIKKLIRAVRYYDAKRVAEEVVNLSTPKEVEKYALTQLKAALTSEELAELL